VYSEAQEPKYKASKAESAAEFLELEKGSLPPPPAAAAKGLGASPAGFRVEHRPL